MWHKSQSNLVARLKRLLGHAHHPPADTRQDENREAEVMQAFRQRALADKSASEDSPAATSPSWRRHRGPLRLVARAALVTVLLGAATATAGRLPVDYALGMGQRVQFRMASNDDPHAELERILDFIRLQILVDKIELMVEASHQDEPMRVTLHLWGPDVDSTSLRSALSDALPESTQLDIESVRGHVRTSIADRVAHQWFRRALDAETVHEARRRILAEFSGRGIECETEVRVEDDDRGHRRIEIRRSVSVSEDGAPPSANDHEDRALEIDTRCHVFESAE